MITSYRPTDEAVDGQNDMLTCHNLSFEIVSVPRIIQFRDTTYQDASFVRKERSMILKTQEDRKNKERKKDRKTGRRKERKKTRNNERKKEKKERKKKRKKGRKKETTK